MINLQTQFLVYLAVLFFSFGCSLWYYRRMHTALRIITVLLGFSLLSELASAYMALYEGSNMAWLHMSSPINLALTALYYNYAVRQFRRYHTGYIIGALGIVLAVVNTVYLQPMQVLDSNFMLFSGACIIGMALFTFLVMFRDNTQIYIARNIHFWLSFIFLIYWCSTFFTWPLLQMVTHLRSGKQEIFYLFFWLINVLFYLLIGALILLYMPKKTIHDA